MTWEADISTIRTPMIDNWDFDAVPVAWPGQNFDPPSRTGDRADPAIWIDFDVDNVDSQYLASGAPSTRHKFAAIDAAILVESIVGNDELIRQKADLLETYYGAGNTASVVFRIEEAVLSDVFIWEETWLRADWTCPVWLF